jgi:hypothetical protein
MPNESFNEAIPESPSADVGPVAHARPEAEPSAAFSFDTSGRVVRLGLDGLAYPHIEWSDLSPFEQGYVEALFESLIDEWRHQVCFKTGDKVRVHTDEIGTVTGRKTGATKSVHVLFRPGFGGQYFPFECTPVAPVFSDLAPETLAAIRKDCADYQERAAKSEADVLAYSGASNAAKVRHAWLGGGGAQFWVQRNTTDNLRAFFPPLTPYLAEDGNVYLREQA